MKKIALFFMVTLWSINGICQNIDSYVGKYLVTEVRSEVMYDVVLGTDTLSYYTWIVKYDDNTLAMPFFAALDTIKATLILDSINIFTQTLSFDDGNRYVIKGHGRFYGDTLKYQYTNSGSIGAFRGSCVAVKTNGNSVNKLEDCHSPYCYPNPFTSTITYSLDIPYSVADAMLNFYRLDGSLRKQVPLSGRGKIIKEIDLGNLQPGTYLTEIVFDKKIESAGRIIKLHE